MSATHWLTTEQVAEELGFTPKTVRIWCIQGRFPHAEKFPDDKPRSEWRIPEADLRDMRATRAVQRGRVLSSKDRARLMNKYAAA